MLFEYLVQWFQSELLLTIFYETISQIVKFQTNESYFSIEIFQLFNMMF